MGICRVISIMAFILISQAAFSKINISTTGGLRVNTPECSDDWLRLGARLEFDQIQSDGDFFDKGNNFPNSGNIRRAFVSVKGAIGDCFCYNLTVDFSRSKVQDFPVFSGDPPFVIGVLRQRTQNLMLVEEAWLGYSGVLDCTHIRIGQFTPVTTLDGYANYGITNAQMCLESALATTAFSPPSYIISNSPALKGLGIISNTQLCDLLTIEASLYQPALGSPNHFGDFGRSDRLGQAVRVTFSPVHKYGLVYHLGLFMRHQSLNHTLAGSLPILNNLFFTTPEVVTRNYTGIGGNISQITDGSPTLINTGAIRTKGYEHYALEAASILGPLTLAGEYHYALVHRRPENVINPPSFLGNLDFHGWHIQAGYVLTAESREYDFERGVLLGIKPCNRFGAWEMVIRYSSVNLIDKNVYGGVSHDTTFGINWYVNCNVRFIFNYIYADILPTGFVAGTQASSIAKRRVNFFGTRFQIIF